jgi:multiple sugar transport system permease protein
MKQKTLDSIVPYGVIVILNLIMLFPVYWIIVSSLQPSSLLMNLPPHFIPESLFLDNYLRIFSIFKYIRFFLNSFIVSFGTVLAVFLIAIPAGYSFSRYFFKGKGMMLTSIMSVQMFPIVVILISLYTFYMRWKLLNTYQGLILADTTFALPLSIMLMKSFFDTIPRSLDESAKIDGAGRLRVLFSILMPLTKPGLVAVGIYTFLNSWDDFLLALTIMQKVNMKTITIGLAQSFLGEYAYDYGALMAFCVIGSLPIVLFFIAFQKYMISGLTAGAVKG